MRAAASRCEAESGAGRDLCVAAACNAAYAMPLATMLASLTANLGPGRKVAVTVLTQDLDDGLKARVEGAVPAERGSIHWIDIERERFASLAATIRDFDTISLESYYRLLLPEVLPRGLDKVLYLDCDLVVLRDLGALWDLDLSGASLLACPELVPDAAVAAAPQGIRRYRELGLAGDTKLFNSGVLLIDLKRWREADVALRALIYLQEAGPDLRWHDQEALNVVLAGTWRELDPTWNVTMHVYGRKLLPAQAAALLDDPGIVHFNSAVKPWHPDFAFGFQDRFFRYLDLTPWAGWRPPPPGPRPRRLGTILRRALQKRRHALRRLKSRLGAALGRRFGKTRPPVALDGPPPSQVGDAEICAFVVADSPDRRLTACLERLRAAAVDRIFLVLREAGTADLAALPSGEGSLHVFRPGERAAPKAAMLRQLLDRFGDGRWCLLLEPDERLLPPGGGNLSLKRLCRSLDDKGFDALPCRLVAMEGASSAAVPDAGDTIELDSVARDPLSGHLFPVTLLVDRPKSLSGDSIAYRSKVPLFKHRRGLAIARDFRAVRSGRLADVRGVVLRRADSA